MGFIKKYQLILFFCAWSFLNFYQAANTVLMNDEAYYWVYSQFLAWGYFDHPPMIALLIKAGYFLFHNESGVRLFIVILNTLTLLVIYSILPRRNDVLFYTIACSIALLQLCGFIAVPDLPLIFFVALFLLVYKKFMVRSSVKNTILLGIVMALMLYSKYHGVLVILFTLLSNPRLFTNAKAYIAVLISALLFMPHLYWQYTHGFPSVQYHLFERNESSYSVLNTLEYIGGQILLAGPLMGWLFLWSALKYKPIDLFERALQFSVWGIYIFFLIATFRGSVEANWTVPAIVPLIVLSHQYLFDKKKLKRILIYTVPLSLIIVLIIRIFMLSYNTNTLGINANEFHQDRKWAQKINTISKGLPVAFISSYQKASKYWFYSGIPAISLNTPEYHRNNYNFWPIEKSLQGKPVYAMSQNDPDFFMDSVETAVGILRGKRIDSFYSHSSVQLKIKNKFIFNKNKFITGNISIQDAGRNIADTSFRRLLIYIFNKKELAGCYTMIAEKTLSPIENFNVSTTVPVILSPGKYLARLAITSAIPGYPTLNSTNVAIIIK